MKKVRIMLAAIIVLGAVSGALALKVKSFGTQIYRTTTNGIVCPVTVSGASFRPGGLFHT
jgi:hypothetical protein